MLELKERVDVPPEDALLALDATRLRQGLGNGVVLTGEAADDHVDIGDINLAVPILVENNVDVLVHHRILAKARTVAAGGKLLGISSGRLPLIGPDGLVRTRGREIHLRFVGIVIPLKAQPKPADARKELGHSDDLLRRHVSPFAVCVALLDHDRRSTGH